MLARLAEREEGRRVGAEVYYTGVQRLEANPFAAASEPYVVVGLVAERQFGVIRVFVNGENLTGLRQMRWQPLIRSDRALDVVGQSMRGHRWTAEISTVVSECGFEREMEREKGEGK